MNDKGVITVLKRTWVLWYREEVSDPVKDKYGVLSKSDGEDLSQETRKVHCKERVSWLVSRGSKIQMSTERERVDIPDNPVYDWVYEIYSSYKYRLTKRGRSTNYLQTTYLSKEFLISLL